VSYGDGWPSYTVQFEHLADRSMRLWLLDGPARIGLGTLTGTRDCGPVVMERVGAALGLTTPEFLVELRIPRPSYLHDGDAVAVRLEDGRSVPATVRAWVNGEVLVETVDPLDGGSGFYALDDLTFPDAG
jgi:hypothetical protein